MGVPSTRTPVRIARGTYANLTTTDALASLAEGEICYATDQGRLYVKEGSGLTSVTATTSASPNPSEVTAAPAFTGGDGSQGNPYLITNGAVPFAGGTLSSTQEITIQGTPGDIVVFSDNSPTASANRFKSQDVGIVNSNGEFKLRLKYNDTPLTTSDNTTYTGNLQIGSVYFTWVVVQSNLTALSQNTATTISLSSEAVGGTATATEGVLAGGTPSYSYTTRWQRSFTGTDGWFDTGISGTTYTIINADSGYYIRAVTTGTDSTAGSAGGPLTLELPSASSNQINVNAVATVNSLVLSAKNLNSSRYTSEQYDITANLAPEGVPTTTKGYKVEFNGTLNQYPQTDNVSSTTSGDPVGSNVNQTSFDGIAPNGPGGGQNDTSSYYDWIAPMWYSGTGGSGFINMALSYSSSNNLQMYWTDTYGVSNDQPYDQLALQNSVAGATQYATSTALNQYYQWYQNEGGGTSTQQVYYYGMYKPDCVLIYGSFGQWMTIDNFSVNKSSSTGSRWKPIAQNHDQASDYQIGFVDANNQKYSVLFSNNEIFVMNGDLTDYVNCTSTTVNVNWNSDVTLPGGYTSGSPINIISHGTKITIVVRYYVNSSYYVFRFYTCDFATNDGTQLSHWVFKTEINTGSSSSISRGFKAVNPDNPNQIILGFDSTASYIAYSSNGGESYVQRGTPSPSGWSSTTPRGFAWQRGKIIMIAEAYYTGNGNGTVDTNRFWTLQQSSDGGTSWTVAQYDPEPVNGSSSSVYTRENPSELLSPQRNLPCVANGGWIFGAGRAGYWVSTYYYYRMGLFIKDQDTINLAGNTNLANNSIRSGDTLLQPGTNPLTSAVVYNVNSGNNTIIVSEFKGSSSFDNGKPLQNTVSYFGSTTSTLYGVMDTGGNISDLTGTDPGYVNVGYAKTNTITFPATLPSGNTPDYELPSGTTIKVHGQFTNGSGSPTATSNTLTPTN